MMVDKKKLNRFIEKSGISFVVLFGSRGAREDSDIDIGVLMKKGMSINNMDSYSEILQGLSDALGVPDYKIDLTDMITEDILLRYEVMCKGEFLGGNDMAYEEMKAFSFREYHDAKSLFRLEDLLIRRKQEHIKEKLKEND